MKLKVDVAKLTTDSTQIEKSIQSMKKQLQMLQKQSSILDSMWDGPTSESFKKEFITDMKTFNTIINNLQKINHYEALAKRKYDTCEKRIGQIVDSIKV